MASFKDIELDKNVAIVILAGGGSWRLGKPKQLLEFEGKSLMRRSVETAVGTGTRAVLVVLGAEHDLVLENIADMPVDIVVNHEWQAGMSTSIKCALHHLRHSQPEISAAVFMLADQPMVSVDTLSKLIRSYKSSGAKIVASTYEDTVGVPALFDRSLFEELMSLSGDRGAKVVINDHPDDAVFVAADEAALDIDSLHDYDRLITGQR